MVNKNITRVVFLFLRLMLVFLFVAAVFSCKSTASSHIQDNGITGNGNITQPNNAGDTGQVESNTQSDENNGDHSQSLQSSGIETPGVESSNIESSGTEIPNTESSVIESPGTESPKTESSEPNSGTNATDADNTKGVIDMPVTVVPPEAPSEITAAMKPELPEPQAPALSLPENSSQSNEAPKNESDETQVQPSAPVIAPDSQTPVQQHTENQPAESPPSPSLTQLPVPKQSSQSAPDSQTLEQSHPVPANSQPKEPPSQPPSPPSFLKPAEPVNPPQVREQVPMPVNPLPELPARNVPESSGDQIVFSRIVRATVGQVIEIPFRGTGWVYIGELGNRRGIAYDSRRLDLASRPNEPSGSGGAGSSGGTGNSGGTGSSAGSTNTAGTVEGQSFIFNAESAGTYILKFYKQDFIQDYVINDYVQVIVGDAAANTGADRLGIPTDRGRVIADPRWPPLPESPPGAQNSPTPATALAPVTAGQADSSSIATDASGGGITTVADTAGNGPVPATQSIPPANNTNPVDQGNSTPQAISPNQAGTQLPLNNDTGNAGSTPNQTGSLSPVGSAAVLQNPLPPPPAQPGILSRPVQGTADGSILPVSPPQVSSSAGSNGPANIVADLLQANASPPEYINRAKQEFDAGRVESALTILDAMKQRYPSGTDEAWWLYGQLLEANSSSRDVRLALDYYRRLVSEYPQSPRAGDAQRRISYLERYYINIR